MNLSDYKLAEMVLSEAYDCYRFLDEAEVNAMSDFDFDCLRLVSVDGWAMSTTVSTGKAGATLNLRRIDGKRLVPHFKWDKKHFDCARDARRFLVAKGFLLLCVPKASAVKA